LGTLCDVIAFQIDEGPLTAASATIHSAVSAMHLKILRYDFFCSNAQSGQIYFVIRHKFKSYR
jgi:hypothetical protein